MPEKKKQDLLGYIRQLEQENNALKSLCTNKAAESEKLIERLLAFEWTLKKKANCINGLPA